MQDLEIDWEILRVDDTFDYDSHEPFTDDYGEEYIWSEYCNQYLMVDYVTYTVDQWPVGEDCETTFTNDTNEHYVDDSKLFYTEDSREWYASDDDLYQDYETDEYYESDEYIITCVSDDNTYYDYRGDDFTYLYEWPYGEWHYPSDECEYCECCEESHHEDHECERDGWLDWYQSSSSWYVLNGEASKYRFWIEIETDEVVDIDVANTLKENGWRCERDWSVEWWEYITPILPLSEKGIEFVKTYWGEAIEWVSSGSSDCGGHIHISEKDREAKDLYNDVKHYRQVLWWIYPWRTNRMYCNKDEENEEKKYRDVRICTKYNTVEFRIFPWLDSLKQVDFRLELIQFFITNVANTKQEALTYLNEKQVEFLNILDVVYPSLEKKMQVISRIYKFYELDETSFKKICSKAYKILTNK